MAKDKSKGRRYLDSAIKVAEAHNKPLAIVRGVKTVAKKIGKVKKRIDKWEMDNIRNK